MNAIDGSLSKIFGDGYIKGKRRAKKVALNYMRAYGKLFALTFLEVFVGLLLLKIPYALIMAVCIASVDILPVLGAGAILLPWSLAMFLCGDHRMSLALVVLYGVITIVRQIAEPRILGARLGIHPLMSLFCVTLGVGLFGWIGVFVGPIFASIATGALRSDSESTVNTDHLTCDK